MAIAIYARQSIEKDNSISCDTQVEQCKYCLKPDERKEKLLVYVDEGFTGANTNRADFQRMMRDVERGKIKKSTPINLTESVVLLRISLI